MKRLFIVIFIVISSSETKSQNVTFSPSNEITISKIINNPDSILKPNDTLKFYFDNVKHKDYDFLLNEVINPEMNKKWGKRWRKDDTWTIATKLRIWLREFLDKGGWTEGNYWVGDYKTELFSIPEILSHNKNEKDGLCSYYATFYMHCCLAVGINNRRVGWWQPGGDQLNEVYVPEIKKWVAVSPLYNSWYSDTNGIPLSLNELNTHRHLRL